MTILRCITSNSISYPSTEKVKYYFLPLSIVFTVRPKLINKPEDMRLTIKETLFVPNNLAPK